MPSGFRCRSAASRRKQDKGCRLASLASVDTTPGLQRLPDTTIGCGLAIHQQRDASGVVAGVSVAAATKMRVAEIAGQTQPAHAAQDVASVR